MLVELEREAKVLQPVIASDQVLRDWITAMTLHCIERAREHK